MLTAIAFLLILFFFDQNNWFVQRNRQKELESINQKIEFLTQESAKMEIQLKELSTDTNYLEKYAREHYHEKKDNEDLYLIIPDSEANGVKK